MKKKCKHDYQVIKVDMNRKVESDMSLWGYRLIQDGKPYAELLCVRCGSIKYMPVKYPNDKKEDN